MAAQAHASDVMQLFQDIQRAVPWIPSHGKKTYLVAGNHWENWKGSFHPFPPSTIQRTQTTFCVTWVEPHPVSVPSCALSHSTLQEWPWWVKTNRTEDSWGLWLYLIQGLSARYTERAWEPMTEQGKSSSFAQQVVPSLTCLNLKYEPRWSLLLAGGKSISTSSLPKNSTTNIWNRLKNSLLLSASG